MAIPAAADIAAAIKARQDALDVEGQEPDQMAALEALVDEIIKAVKLGVVNSTGSAAVSSAPGTAPVTATGSIT